jgi:hypothetical protein
MICTVILSFGRKGGTGLWVLPQKIFTFLKLLGLNFWRFLKQICKQIGCKLTIFLQIKWLSFHKNNYFITQILPENVKILTWILHNFYLNFTAEGGVCYTPSI